MLPINPAAKLYTRECVCVCERAVGGGDVAVGAT